MKEVISSSNLFRFLANIDIKIMLTHINEIKYRSNNLSHEMILSNDRVN